MVSLPKCEFLLSKETRQGAFSLPVLQGAQVAQPWALASFNVFSVFFFVLTHQPQATLLAAFTRRVQKAFRLSLSQCSPDSLIPSLEALQRLRGLQFWMAIMPSRRAFQSLLEFAMSFFFSFLSCFFFSSFFCYYCFVSLVFTSAYLLVLFRVRYFARRHGYFLALSQVTKRLCVDYSGPHQG